ncbi:MAG: single-stranded DNA-binding protein [Candidatus Cloacimonadota bacterium]|nr:single-stranded DNA-binding protein [Candidatus Cloacimonadota bacterium]
MNKKAPSLNRISLAGNIVRDPEVRHVGSKKTAVTNITIANNRSYLDKDKNWQEETTYVETEIWGRQAEKVEEKCKKGDPVIIEGSLKNSNWKDKDGNSHSKLLVKVDKVHILQNS